MDGRSRDNSRARKDGDREHHSPPRPEVQRLERDSYILLQHAYTLTGADPAVPVNATRLGADLGFAESETSRLVRYLSWIGYLKESAAGPHLALAEEAIEYLEEGAGRRHSVRADEKQVPIPVFVSR